LDFPTTKNSFYPNAKQIPNMLVAPAPARAAARSRPASTRAVPSPSSSSPRLPLRTARPRSVVVVSVAAPEAISAAQQAPAATAAAAKEAVAAFDALLQLEQKVDPSPAGQQADPRRPGWFKAWWPVAAVENLDTDRPNALELMGERLVAWQRADGSWTVQADRCPHRLAPLSDGFVAKDKSAIVCGCE
jgi:hypothetical protein